MSIHILGRQRRYNLLDYPTNVSMLPTDIVGLAYWYKADSITGVASGGVVNTWSSSMPDPTTHLTSSTFASPTLVYNRFGGMPGVNFNGSNQGLETWPHNTTIVLTGLYSIITFTYFAPVTVQILNLASGIGNQQMRFNSGTNLFMFDGVSVVGTFNSPQNNVSKMISFVKDTTTSMVTYDAITPLISPGAFTDYTWNNFGVQWSSQGDWFNGSMAEILIYRSSLTVSQLKQLHDNYFKIKYLNDGSFQ
jgi:hypothetical protein